MPTKAHKAAGARLCRAFALLCLLSFEAGAATFDSPLRSAAWAAMSDGARVAAVIGCVVIPLFMLCMLAAGGRKERRLGLALVGVLALLWGSYARLAGTVWYVRPITAEYGAEDGSSYAAAFDGLGDITWGVGGAQAGDTLKVCGTFLQSSANTANTNLAMMQVAASGSDGSPIVIDGDCSAEGDLAVGVLDGDYTSGSVIRTRENTYLTLRNLDLSGAKDAGITAYQAAGSETATAKHIRIESTVTIHDIHGGASNKVGINLAGTNFTIGDYSTTGRKLSIYDIGTDAIFCYSCGSLFIDGAYIEQVSTDDSNGDCVQLQRNASGDRVWDVYCNKGNNDAKQGVVVSTLDSQAYIVDIARLTYIGAGGTVSNGVYAEGQTTVRQSYIKDSGNYSLVAALNNSAKLTATGNILVGATNGCIDGHKTSAGGTVNAYNNTMHNCGLAAVDLAAATASHDIKNNTITGSATVGIYRGASGTTDDYNNVYGPATPYSNNGGAGSASANDKAVDPKFIGGPNPTTADGFRPAADSPLAGAGTDLGDEISDYFGDTMYNGKWDIGAFRRDSCYRRSRDGKLDPARTRAQVVSRCRGIPRRYPEGL